MAELMNYSRQDLDGIGLGLTDVLFRYFPGETEETHE
jgi:hypothetical protein